MVRWPLPMAFLSAACLALACSGGNDANTTQSTAIATTIAPASAAPAATTVVRSPTVEATAAQATRPGNLPTVPGGVAITRPAGSVLPAIPSVTVPAGAPGRGSISLKVSGGQSLDNSAEEAVCAPSGSGIAVTGRAGDATLTMHIVNPKAGQFPITPGGQDNATRIETIALIVKGSGYAGGAGTLTLTDVAGKKGSVTLRGMVPLTGGGAPVMLDARWECQ